MDVLQRQQSDMSINVRLTVLTKFQSHKELFLNLKWGLGR